MIDQQIQVDAQIQQMADSITSLFSETLVVLLERREKRYAAAIAAIEREQEALLQEARRITETTHDLEATLPAKRRELQRQSDQLLLKGKREQAAAKLAEAEADPLAELQKRTTAIHARLEATEVEKRAIAKHVFGEWFSEAQHVCRAAERAYLIVLLNGLEDSCYRYQETTGTGTSDNRQRSLLNPGYIAGLTANGSSPEFQAGTRWYGGRR